MRKLKIEAWEWEEKIYLRHSQKGTILIRFRDVFRTQSKIHDRAFLRKQFSLILKFLS